MLITNAELEALRTSFRTEFDKGLAMAGQQYGLIASTVPSTSRSNTYGWLGDWPEMIEWVGPRQVKSMAEGSYNVVNKKWEATVGVKVDDLEDNNLGHYATRFQASGQSVKEHPDKLIFALLKDGFNQLCSDGQNFFDDDHPVNAEHDGSGANTSVSNMKVDVGYAAAPWFILDTSRPLKPLIFQQRKKPTFVAMDKPNDEGRFTIDEVRYGVDSRDNAGFGYWQMAFGCKCELTHDNVWHALLAMAALKGDGNRPLNIDGKVIVIHPTLQRQAHNIFKKETLTGGSGEGNELFGRLNIIQSGFLV